MAPAVLPRLHLRDEGSAHVALPPLTPEQRQAALDKAAASRRERAEIKNRLKNSGASIVEVLREGETNEVIGKMRVIELLQSMPGLGKVRARQLMERLSIHDVPEPRLAVLRATPDQFLATIVTPRADKTV